MRAIDSEDSVLLGTRDKHLMGTEHFLSILLCDLETVTVCLGITAFSFVTSMSTGILSTLLFFMILVLEYYTERIHAFIVSSSVSAGRVYHA